MSVVDILVVVIAIFVMSVSLLFSSLFLDEFGSVDKIQGTEFEDHINNTKTALGSINSLFPFIFVGFMGAIAIGSFFVKTHPVFLIVSIVLLGFFMIMSGTFVNIFNEVAGADQFATVVDEYDNIVGAWQNMPVLILFAGAVIIIALYAKTGGIKGGPTY